MKSTILTLALAAAFAVALPAAPLRVADLGEKPAWILHADFDSIRADLAAKKLSGAFPPKAPALLQFKAATGFDTREHLTGITAYGTGERGAGAVLIRYKFSDEKLTGWLAQSGKAVSIGTTPNTRFELPIGHFHGQHALGDVAAKDVPSKKVFADFSRPGVLVLAADVAGLDAALARLSATKAVTTLPSHYEWVSPQNAGFSVFVNFPAVRAARNGQVPSWAKYLNLFALSISASDKDIEGVAYAAMDDGDSALHIANMIRAFMVAQAPRFPALGERQHHPLASDQEKYITMFLAIPVEQLIFGISANAGNAAPAAPAAKKSGNLLP